MASAFSFGFSGDDIDQTADDNLQPDAPPAGLPHPASDDGDQAPTIKPKRHDIEEMLNALPEKVAYTIQTVTSPKGNTIHLPRREIFDIRVQLMAEDDGSDPDLLAGLNDDSDIRTNVYEGGFKNWECSIDLVRFLLDRGPRKDIDDMSRVDHVIELGAGTSLPALTLLHHALTNNLPLTLTITDFNPTVLQYLTLPNLVLLHASLLSPTSSPFTPDDPNPLNPASPAYAPEGDIAMTSALKTSFLDALRASAIDLNLISGPWSPEGAFPALIPSAPDLRTFVLAAETIYSPSALQSFTAALATLLKRVRAGKALVGAKKVYFGVGGGVEMFREECAKYGLVAYEVDFEGLGQEGVGVRRSLVEVQVLGGGEVGQ